MVENGEVAKHISNLMLDFSAQLDTSVALVRERCSQVELEAYRLAVGRIMGDMLLEVMNPLYKIHPNLRPPEFDA